MDWRDSILRLFNEFKAIILIAPLNEFRQRATR